MGLLGTAAQLFNTARKSPVAGKFMQRTGNFLQRNFNPVSAQGYKQTLRNLGPTGRANVRDFNRTGLRKLGDDVRAASAMPTARNIGRGLMGAGIADALSKGDYGSAATEAALFAPGKTLGALKTVGRMAAPFLVKPVLGAGALFAAVEGLAPARVATGTMDDYYKTLTPEQKKKFEADTRNQQENMSDAEKRRMGITPADPLVTRLPTGSVFENLPPDLLPGGPTPELPGALTINNSPNNLPSSPEAVVANPLQQKMAEYEQGRAKATTQEEMNAVRDLGMSIHQAANPQMYEESYNPLMAATFPERYNKTPEDFILQGGIQSPRGMSDKDARQATAFGNKIQTMQSAEVEPMYNPFESVEEYKKAAAAGKRFQS